MTLISEIRFRRMVSQIQMEIIVQEFGPLSRYALGNLGQEILTSLNLEEKKSQLFICRLLWEHRFMIILVSVIILALSILWVSWFYNLPWLEGSIHWIYLNWVYDSPTIEYP